MCTVIFWRYKLIYMENKGGIMNCIKKENFFRRPKFKKGCKLFLLIVGVVVLSFVVKSIVMFVAAYIMEQAPYENVSGIENYDKADIVKEHGSDIDSELLIFPDKTDKMVEATFEARLKTGLFDTEGYIILQGRYSESDFEKEVDRISKVECEVSDIVAGVRYDDKSYSLPAYVAVDGNNGVYEYALVDSEKYEITYILLSYPDLDELEEYKNYLKLEEAEYREEATWDRFSIYSRHFEDGEYVEYSDEK